MLRLGSLAGRVGFSMAGNTVANLFRDSESRDTNHAAVMMKNAIRVKDSLGQLKGVPMKIGQMVSLHERFFPKEVVEVLRTLQQKAPAVPFEDIVRMIRFELGSRMDLIDFIDENPMASASIGQVHRAMLKDGREIVLKVQYPGIDEVIRSDMKNLKGILKMVFSMFTRMDMESVWQELNDRLTEELDYEMEAANMKRMAQVVKDDEAIIVPRVIEELSTRHVLAMELVLGISPDQITASAFPQDLRNTWGKTIARLTLRGLLVYRFMHADPNIANFAFLQDGRVIVYDFGCMKEIPGDLRDGYLLLTDAMLEHDYPDIPAILKSMGIHQAGGTPISWKLVADFGDLIQEMIRPEKCYTFGEDKRFYARLVSVWHQHMGESMTIVFPGDIIFIDRTLNGHLGNLGRLSACADWRDIVSQTLREGFTSSPDLPRRRRMLEEG